MAKHFETTIWVLVLAFIMMLMVSLPAQAEDELLDKPFYSFFKRSIGVVNGLEGKGKVALTDDGTSWYFSNNNSASQAQ